MDYDELVQQLRDWSDTHSFSVVPRSAAEAITQLSAERDRLWKKHDFAIKQHDKLTRMHAERTVERDALLEQRRNLLDEDLKAKVCVDLQRELNKAKAERDAIAGRHELALIAGAELREERDALAARISYLEPIFIAARNLVDNAEEYECDGLGLFAQHGWWEPLHDALDPDGSAAADDIRQPVTPAK